MKLIIIFALITFCGMNVNAGTYQIDGDFNGCEHGKIYPLLGGGVLECNEYHYWYQYSPQVRTDGREVILIGDQKISASILDGSVIETRVRDTFEGCDYDKRIDLDNGLIFVCKMYSYSYSYRPKVSIISVDGRPYEVYINDNKYSGTLYRK